MGKRDEIPIFLVILLSSIIGVAIGFVLLFLVTDNPLLFIFDRFAGDKIIFLLFLGIVSAAIGFGLAFSSKNGN